MGRCDGRTVMSRRVFSLFAALLLVGVSNNGSATPITVGPQPDGTSLTPQGWHVTPAGAQTDVGPNPLAAAVSPDGSLVLVANAGYSHHSLMVLDATTGAILQTIGAA